MTISLGLLSTYPPTQCGIATFTASLVGAFTGPHDQAAVVSIVDARTPRQPSEVVHQWVRGRHGGALAAAAVLESQQVAIIEHEFGIFGGDDGADVLDVIAELTVPLITVMHTVLAKPSLNQRQIVSTLLRRSDRTVVMTRAARERLIDVYQAEPARVVVIPHGAPDIRHFVRPRLTPMRRSRPVVLTWGLLGPGKGIEWAIEAMALLKGTRPMPRYLVVGETHPRVLANDGESYRDHLTSLVRRSRLEDVVSFDARYHRTKELFRIANAADLVLLPYDSAEQVTSGVLAEAVALGKPVISTGFPHARELLGSGAGLIVERRDPASIADALHQVISEPRLMQRMATEARRLAPELHWSSVAERYRRLALEVVESQRPLEVTA
ncbi:MAG: glycosyltransferase [Candidatus Nanopelagicales bacterium]